MAVAARSEPLAHARNGSPRPPRMQSTPSPPPGSSTGRPAGIGRPMAAARGSTPQAGGKARSSKRPQSHCGAFQRPIRPDEDIDAPDCSHAGAAARESVGSCRLCLKLRLRLENAERARMRAQEQLAQQQVENLRLRGVVTRPVLEYATEQESAESRVIEAPAGTTDNDGANLLESYRREVEVLQARLRERDEREAIILQNHRRELRDHESSRQEWETQVAGLVCEVQEWQALAEAKDPAAARTGSRFLDSSTTCGVLA